MDQALSLSGVNSLYLHPERALDADTAYDVMSYGTSVSTFIYINSVGYRVQIWRWKSGNGWKLPSVNVRENRA